MNELTYALPVKAKEIFEELFEGECCESNVYLQLSVMLANAGFQDGANWAWQKSQDERGAAKRWADYAQTRGVVISMEKYEEEKVTATDMKSAVLEAGKLELKALERLESACRMMFDVDLLSYSEIQSYLSSQKWELDEMQKMWTVFSQLESFEDQYETQRTYFLPVESIPC